MATVAQAPFTAVDWRRALNLINFFFDHEFYHSCIERCTDLLDLSDVSTSHQASIHHLAALSHEALVERSMKLSKGWDLRSKDREHHLTAAADHRSAAIKALAAPNPRVRSCLSQLGLLVELPPSPQSISSDPSTPVSLENIDDPPFRLSHRSSIPTYPSESAQSPEREESPSLLSYFEICNIGRSGKEDEDFAGPNGYRGAEDFGRKKDGVHFVPSCARYNNCSVAANNTIYQWDRPTLVSVGQPTHSKGHLSSVESWIH